GGPGPRGPLCPKGGAGRQGPGLPCRGPRPGGTPGGKTVAKTPPRPPERQHVCPPREHFFGPTSRSRSARSTQPVGHACAEAFGRDHFFRAGVTVTVQGVDGSATRTSGRLVAAGSRLNGPWASRRRTTVYSPGGTFGATVSLTVAPVFPVGTSVAATRKPGGRFRPLSCTFPVKPGQ